MASSLAESNTESVCVLKEGKFGFAEVETPDLNRWSCIPVAWQIWDLESRLYQLSHSHMHKWSQESHCKAVSLVTHHLSIQL